jgi:tRNA U54 and U55 pseudouridine synthase Pus10
METLSRPSHGVRRSRSRPPTVVGSGSGTDDIVVRWNTAGNVTANVNVKTGVESGRKVTQSRAAAQCSDLLGKLCASSPFSHTHRAISESDGTRHHSQAEEIDAGKVIERKDATSHLDVDMQAQSYRVEHEKSYRVEHEKSHSVEQAKSHRAEHEKSHRVELEKSHRVEHEKSSHRVEQAKSHRVEQEKSHRVEHEKSHRVEHEKSHHVEHEKSHRVEHEKSCFN